MQDWQGRRIETPQVSHLRIDPSVAKSSLQKSIRRGNLKHALEATAFLLAFDAQAFWRRLMVIALEEVGIADLPTAEASLVFATRKRLRADLGGDWHVASNLVTSLTLGIKCRDACDALVIADLHPKLQGLRSNVLELDERDLCELLVDSAAGVGERALAAWAICGTHKFPAAKIAEKRGSFGDLLEIYRHMGASSDVLHVAQLGANRLREGHPLSLPLIWLLASWPHQSSVQSYCVNTPSLIGGWPEYAYDMHTAPGRRAISIFVN